MGRHYNGTCTKIKRESKNRSWKIRGLFFLWTEYNYIDHKAKKGEKLKEKDHSHAYQTGYRYRMQNNMRALEGKEKQVGTGRSGTSFLIRFSVSAFLLLLFLLSSQFSKFFPDGISDQIYEQVINNDLYTKLQNYVIMILYD